MPDPYFATSCLYQERKGIRKKNPESEEDKTRYTISLEDVLRGKDQRTTLMIKNIPNKYNQRMLLKAIDECCKRQYDFFYLPIDFRVRLSMTEQNKCNVGYAFINFVSPLYILYFYGAFNARKWEKFNSEKVCHVLTS